MRLSRTVLAVATVLVLVACNAQVPQANTPTTGTSEAPQTEAPPTSVSLNFLSPIDSFYPSGNTESYDFFANLYDSMVNRRHPDPEYTPMIAQSWDRPDPLTWVIHINPAARWADGTPITAHDVVFTLDRMKTDPASRRADHMDGVESFTATDDLTLEVKTEESLPILDFIGNKEILQKAHYDRLGADEGDRQPMVSGPYELAEWLPGERVVMRKRADYWGKDLTPPPHPTYSSGEAPDEVVYRWIQEPEVGVTALLNGELDLVRNVPAHLKERVLQNPGFRIESQLNTDHMLFILNPKTEAMAKLEVRQAIYHAIDIDALVAGPLQNDVRPLRGPVGETNIAYNPDLDVPEYDPEKARGLLAQAGYTDGVKIDFMCPTGAYLYERELCEAVGAMLAEVGIDAAPQFVEFSTYRAEFRENKYEMYLTNAAHDVVNDPLIYDNYFECELERTDWCNREFTDFHLAQYAMERNSPERVEGFKRAFEVLMADAPAVFLYQYLVSFGVSEKIQWEPLHHADAEVYTTSMSVGR